LDVLTDVLSTLRLKGKMYFRTEFDGDWGVALPADRNTIRFHLVIYGQCWTTVDGKSVHLREGDFALIPHGAAQVLSSDQSSPAVALGGLIKDGNLGSDGVLRYGRPNPSQQTRLVCGFCSFDEELNHPLFLGLPPVILLGQHTTGNSPWLAQAVRVIAMESDLHAIGGSAVISRLMEVLFIQGIRHQSQTASNAAIPFMVAIADKQLKPAIEAMHDQPARAWSVADLAALSGMSRGRFSQRFKDCVGRPPLQYLTEWRLQMARRLLKESSLTVAEVGLRAGYHSLPSFTRRFRKQFGTYPGAFRKGDREIGA
jgi:AraC-like DNA-binding protein